MSSAPHPASMGAMPPGARGSGVACLEAQRALSGSQFAAAEAARTSNFKLLGSLLVFILGVAAAEMVTTYLHPQAGMGLHGAILVGVMLYSALRLRGAAQKLLVTLALAPLIRLVNLSMPLAQFQLSYRYMITGTPLLISAMLAWRLTGFRRESIGLSTGREWPVQISVALCGLGFGWLEYHILRPQPLAQSFSLDHLWMPALILLVFTGFLEELIFRGLMQTAAEPVLKRMGVVYISLLFAVLHTGYRSAVDVVFVFLVGLFFGLVVQRTRSLAGVTLAHGLTNITLFLIVPFV